MSTNIYSIYKATCIVTGKSYIGYTENFQKRKQIHYNDSFNSKHQSYNYHFHRAIRKYGWDNFEWEVIYQSLDSEHTLKEMEPYFIKYYDSFHNGLNMTLGSEGTPGFCHPRMFGNTNPMAILRTNAGSFLPGRTFVYTSEHKGKQRIAKLGSKNHNYKNPDAAKFLNEPQTCIICGMTTNSGNIKRWHNEKCKKDKGNYINHFLCP